ncbi:hypothetical protein Esti_006865 [Eimeria stiedai]
MCSEYSYARMRQAPLSHTLGHARYCPKGQKCLQSFPSPYDESPRSLVDFDSARTSYGTAEDAGAEQALGCIPLEALDSQPIPIPPHRFIKESALIAFPPCRTVAPIIGFDHDCCANTPGVESASARHLNAHDEDDSQLPPTKFDRKIRGRTLQRLSGGAGQLRALSKEAREPFRSYGAHPEPLCRALIFEPATHAICFKEHCRQGNQVHRYSRGGRKGSAIERIRQRQLIEDVSRTETLVVQDEDHHRLCKRFPDIPELRRLQLRFSPLNAGGGNAPSPYDPRQVPENQSCCSLRCPRSSTRAEASDIPHAYWDDDAENSTHQRERRYEQRDCLQGQENCLPLEVRLPALREAGYVRRCPTGARSQGLNAAATKCPGLQSDTQRVCLMCPERLNWPEPFSASAAHSFAARESQQNVSRDGISQRVEAVLPVPARPRVMPIPGAGQQPAQYDAATESPQGKLRLSKTNGENVAQELARQTPSQQQQSQQLKALERPKRREQQCQQLLLQDATRFYEQQVPAGTQETAKQVGGLPHPPTRQQHSPACLPWGPTCSAIEEGGACPNLPSSPQKATLHDSLKMGGRTLHCSPSESTCSPLADKASPQARREKQVNVGAVKTPVTAHSADPKDFLKQSQCSADSPPPAPSPCKESSKRINTPEHQTPQAVELRAAGGAPMAEATTFQPAASVGNSCSPSSSRLPAEAHQASNCGVAVAVPPRGSAKTSSETCYAQSLSGQETLKALKPSSVETALSCAEENDSKLTRKPAVTVDGRAQATVEASLAARENPCCRCRLERSYEGGLVSGSLALRRSPFSIRFLDSPFPAQLADSPQAEVYPSPFPCRCNEQSCQNLRSRPAEYPRQPAHECVNICLEEPVTCPTDTAGQERERRPPPNLSCDALLASGLQRRGEASRTSCCSPQCVETQPFTPNEKEQTRHMFGTREQLLPSRESIGCALECSCPFSLARGGKLQRCRPQLHCAANYEGLCNKSRSCLHIDEPHEKLLRGTCPLRQQVRKESKETALDVSCAKAPSIKAVEHEVPNRTCLTSTRNILRCDTVRQLLAQSEGPAVPDVPPPSKALSSFSILQVSLTPTLLSSRSADDDNSLAGGDLHMQTQQQNKQGTAPAGNRCRPVSTNGGEKELISHSTLRNRALICSGFWAAGKCSCSSCGTHLVKNRDPGIACIPKTRALGSSEILKMLELLSAGRCDEPGLPLPSPCRCCEVAGKLCGLQTARRLSAPKPQTTPCSFSSTAKCSCPLHDRVENLDILEKSSLAGAADTTTTDSKLLLSGTRKASPQTDCPVVAPTNPSQSSKHGDPSADSEGKKTSSPSPAEEKVTKDLQPVLTIHEAHAIPCIPPDTEVHRTKKVKSPGRLSASRWLSRFRLPASLSRFRRRRAPSTIAICIQPSPKVLITSSASKGAAVLETVRSAMASSHLGQRTKSTHENPTSGGSVPFHSASDDGDGANSDHTHPRSRMSKKNAAEVLFRKDVPSSTHLEGQSQDEDEFSSCMRTSPNFKMARFYVSDNHNRLPPSDLCSLSNYRDSPLLPLNSYQHPATVEHPRGGRAASLYTSPTDNSVEEVLESARRAVAAANFALEKPSPWQGSSRRRHRRRMRGKGLTTEDRGAFGLDHLCLEDTPQFSKDASTVSCLLQESSATPSTSHQLEKAEVQRWRELLKRSRDLQRIERSSFAQALS